MSGFGGGFLLNQGGHGAGGAGGGGGNAPNYHNDSQYPTSATKSNASPYKNDNKNKGTIVPLTIKKLLEASNRTDDKVEVDGHPVDQAVILGRVYKMEEQSTRIILHMDDTTGRLQIAYYKKTDTQSYGVDKFQYDENMYVKAIVVVRPFKTQKMYICNMLETVKDYNQIAYHFLGIFLASAYRNKGPLPKTDPNATNTTNAANAPTQNQFGGNQNMNNNQGGYGGYQPMGNMGNTGNMGFRDQGHKDPMLMVKDAIQQIQYKTSNGVCKQSHLVNYLKTRLDPSTINECLMRLENNGAICREGDSKTDPGFVLLGNEGGDY